MTDKPRRRSHLTKAEGFDAYLFNAGREGIESDQTIKTP